MKIAMFNEIKKRNKAFVWRGLGLNIDMNGVAIYVFDLPIIKGILFNLSGNSEHSNGINFFYKTLDFLKKRHYIGSLRSFGKCIGNIIGGKNVKKKDNKGRGIWCI